LAFLCEGRDPFAGARCGTIDQNHARP
jgi:hypothetical protein